MLDNYSWNLILRFTSPGFCNLVFVELKNFIYAEKLSAFSDMQCFVWALVTAKIHGLPPNIFFLVRLIILLHHFHFSGTLMLARGKKSIQIRQLWQHYSRFHMIVAIFYFALYVVAKLFIMNGCHFYMEFEIV